MRAIGSRAGRSRNRRSTSGRAQELAERLALIRQRRSRISIAQYTQPQIDPGHLGGAEFALAKVLWADDPKRAHALLEDALAKLNGASWRKAHAEASEWLRLHR